MNRPVSEVFRETTEALERAGFDDARSEAASLLAHALKVDRMTLKMNPSRLMDDKIVQPLLFRRLGREPVAFITGKKGFWTLDLHVSQATLIPRPDSETLIEAAIATFTDKNAVPHILDLGTGTGCLLLAALVEFPDAFGIGADIIPACTVLAKRNAAANGLADRSAFIAARWSAPVQGQFDLILSNPPYIPSADIPGLMPEVARHEPCSALDGGADGLDAYRTIIETTRGLLKPGGALILELGIGQSDQVAALAVQKGFAPPTTRRDVGGIERAMILRRSE